MTLREKIEVMEAFERGAEVEWSYKHQNIWDSIREPTWSWNVLKYRIKPKPKQTVIIQKWLSRNNGYFIAQGDKEYLESMYPLSKVKLLDTYEVTL